MGVREGRDDELGVLGMVEVWGGGVGWRCGVEVWGGGVGWRWRCRARPGGRVGNVIKCSFTECKNCSVSEKTM